MSKYYVSFVLEIEKNEDSVFWSQIDNAEELIVYYKGASKLIFPIDSHKYKDTQIKLTSYLKLEETAKIVSMILNEEKAKVIIGTSSGEYVGDYLKTLNISGSVKFISDNKNGKMQDISFLVKRKGIIIN